MRRCLEADKNWCDCSTDIYLNCPFQSEKEMERRTTNFGTEINSKTIGTYRKDLFSINHALKIWKGKSQEYKYLNDVRCCFFPEKF